MTEETEAELVPLTDEEITLREDWEAGTYDREVAQVERARQLAYAEESDPLFFKYQRNEDGVTKQAWLDKIEEIRARYPLPEKPAE